MKAFLYPKGPEERGVRQAGTHWYLYDVLMDGQEIITDCREPTCDLARALLARGIKGRVMVHDGNTGKHRFTIDVEGAAKLRVDDLKMYFDQWKPWAASAVPAQTGETHSPLSTTTPKGKPNGKDYG